MKLIFKVVLAVSLIGCTSSFDNGYSREATYTVEVVNIDGNTSEVTVKAIITAVNTNFFDSLTEAGYYENHVMKVGLDGMYRYEHEDSISYFDEKKRELVRQDVSDTLYRTYYFYNKDSTIADSVTIYTHTVKP